MTLATLRAQCQRRTGSNLSAEFYNDGINEALFAIVDLHDWPWLEDRWTFTSRVGTDRYPLPPDAVRVRSVNVGATELHHVAPADIDSGRVEGWAVTGDTLVLVPVPSQAAAVVVRYVRQETPLVGDADVPALPDQFAGAVVAYVSGLVYEREGDLKKLAVAQARFDQWRRRMLAESRRYTGPTRIRATANRGL